MEYDRIIGRLHLPFHLFFLPFLLLLLHCAPLWPDEEANPEDPAGAIGMTLGELYETYGVPLRVYSSRGLEEWQDDVIFSYQDRDFYIYRDRVWQLAVRSAYGIKVGDSRNAIPLVMGDGAEELTGYTLYTLEDHPWPVKVRFNADARGEVTAIFMYRSDF